MKKRSGRGEEEIFIALFSLSLFFFCCAPSDQRESQIECRAIIQLARGEAIQYEFERSQNHIHIQFLIKRNHQLQITAALLLMTQLRSLRERER
jgi:hypothetical protein